MIKLFSLLLLFISFSFADKISTFKVEAMHCPLCTTAVKKAVRTLDGVEKVSARLNTKEVKVIHKDSVKIEDILKAIKTTSYEGKLLLSEEYNK